MNWTKLLHIWWSHLSSQQLSFMDIQRCGSKAEHQVTSHMLLDELKADLPRSTHHELLLQDRWSGHPKTNQTRQRKKLWLIKIWGRRTPNSQAQRSQMCTRQSRIIVKRPWKNACAQVKRKLKKRCQTNGGWFEILTHSKDSSDEKWCSPQLAARAKQSHLMEAIES